MVGSESIAESAAPQPVRRRRKYRHRKAPAVNPLALVYDLSTRLCAPSDELPLQRVALVIAKHMNVSVDALCSTSRKPPLSLARGLFAWYVMRFGIATQRQAAAFLGCKPPTLSTAQSRHLANKHTRSLFISRMPE